MKNSLKSKTRFDIHLENFTLEKLNMIEINSNSKNSGTLELPNVDQ